MKSFLTLQSVEDVLAHLRSFKPCPEERTPLDEAVGRRLAQAFVAPADLPGFDRSTVDGYAVRARDVFGAQEGSPALLECVGDCPMGRAPDLTLEEGRTARILTGGMLPRGADCVVMVEYSRPAGKGMVELARTQAPGDNVILHDDDAAAGAELLPEGRRLRPEDIGLLAAFGVREVATRRPARVAILSTGDEVLPIEEEPRPGQVRDVNAHTLSALCREAGAHPFRAGLVRDDPEALREAVVRLAAEADIVAVSGGSSAGMRDHTVNVFTSLPGSELLTHGVSISPGKPFILARAPQGDRDVCLMGLPGHVTSALICARVFLVPLIERLQGCVRPEKNAHVPARLLRSIASAQGRRDYIRVRLHPCETGEAAWNAEPVVKASGLMTGMCDADALLVCPENREGYAAGEIVGVEML